MARVDLPTTLPLVAVVAVAENGVIGRDNDLPWRLRTDLRRFKALTMGKPMIVGRRNWEAIGRPLPGRETIVLTRSTGFAAPGAHVARDWPEAVALANRIADLMGAGEIIVGGGAEVYRLALPDLARLHVTRVHATPAGDVLFPPYEDGDYRETFREDHPAGEGDEHPFTFVDLARIGRDTPARDGSPG